MRLKKILVHSLFKKKNKINYRLNRIEEISEYYFTFTGEFGYEILVWIPYLTYVSHTLKIKFNIICKKGLEDLYELYTAVLLMYTKQIIIQKC